MDETEFATLTGLVARYSPSGEESNATSWLVDRMLGLGFDQGYLDAAGNAVGVLGNGSRQVVLLGHIDTVVGEMPVRVQDGVLSGRGSVDAKAPLAAFVDAVAGCGTIPGWQMVVIGAVDEEGDSRGARYLAPRYQPNYAIIGEPGGWQRLTLGYKGCARARVRLQKTASHSASGQATAAESVIALWGALQADVAEINASRERSFEQILLSLDNMASGSDGFNHWAQLDLIARLPLDVPPADWYARLQALAQGAEVQPVGHAIPAYRAEKNTPLVRLFLASIRQQGGAPGFVYKMGTADLNIVAPQWNCPALVYGPGDSRLDHTPNEHVSLTEYRQAVAVLREVLRRVCEG